MEKKELQKEVSKEVEQVKDETPKGYYLAEVPTNFAKVIAKGDTAVPIEELMVKMANALEKAGLMD